MSPKTPPGAILAGFLFGCECQLRASFRLFIQPVIVAKAGSQVILRYMYFSATARPMPMSLRLPAQVDERLSALSMLTGRSKTFYATQAIVEHIDDLEDAHLSSEIRARVRAGTEARIPLSELLDEYGLAR